ncbi:MAG: prolipoprotein diacylglyceryl transferase, partial [Candidatus Riflebacteria bacterium]|nr:prolipoprotein diacylglyceryl transferase [Candidatus Riflebacteria bacterium]
SPPRSLFRSSPAFYGALVGGCFAFWAYCRWRRHDPWALFDMMAPGLALGIFFGRIGCFCGGCCWGTPSDLPWACTFPHAVPRIPRHPVQLYEAIACLWCFFVLSHLLDRPHRRGSIFLGLGLMYASIRFVTEFLRGDPRGGPLVWWFSFSQTMSLPVILVMGGVLLAMRRAPMTDLAGPLDATGQPNASPAGDPPAPGHPENPGVDRWANRTLQVPVFPDRTRATILPDHDGDTALLRQGTRSSRAAGQALKKAAVFVATGSRATESAASAKDGLQ